MTLTFEANRQFLSVRLGRFEFLAIREATPARVALTSPAPGQYILDVPGVAIHACYMHNVR